MDFLPAQENCERLLLFISLGILKNHTEIAGKKI
jgi:hypothetical protein